MYDPLLAGNHPNFNIAQLEEQQKQVSARLEQLRQSDIAYQQQQQQKSSPVWDEIDSIVSGMSDQELLYLNNNAEYQESSAAVQAILQREYLRIMRPIVEATKDGKDALEKHLTLVKRLRKSARDEANKRYSLMDEYIANYSDMPFKDFVEMKKNAKK